MMPWQCFMKTVLQTWLGKSISFLRSSGESAKKIPCVLDKSVGSLTRSGKDGGKRRELSPGGHRFTQRMGW